MHEISISKDFSTLIFVLNGSSELQSEQNISVQNFLRRKLLNHSMVKI